MSEGLKSLIRHALTLLGGLLTVLGLGKYSGALTYLLDNLDVLWASIAAIVGIVTVLYGYFKDTTRFAVRTEAAAINEVSSSNSK